jgi:hypothetical protein
MIVRLSDNFAAEYYKVAGRWGVYPTQRIHGVPTTRKTSVQKTVVINPRR